MPQNPVVGSTVLRRPAIQSPNFVTGSSGWTINSDGSAEFNNLVIRGTFDGTDFIISSSGQFFYSGTPALGNLIASIAPAAGTDSFGNAYEQGIAAYVTTGGKTYALQLGAQQVAGVTAPAFWIADLTSPGHEPPAYTATQSGAGGSGCEIYSGKSLVASTPAFIAVEDSTESGIANGLIILGAGQVQFQGPVSGGLTVDTLAVTTITVGGSSNTGAPSPDSTSTNGLTSGVINGTSGAASAGTAHTHGPGSYAVANGQHAHNLDSHVHAL